MQTMQFSEAVVLAFHSIRAHKLRSFLTLLGVTKPVTLDVTYNKSGVHPYSKKYVSGFSATGTLNRSDFGMTYGLPGVADEVRLIIEVEGESEKAE